MTTNEKKYVTEEILTYYHSKITNYIDEKSVKPQGEFEKRLDAVTQQTTANTEVLKAHREELDDVEARIINLERDDIAIRDDIASIKVDIENRLNETFLESLATKNYVDTAMQGVEDKIEDAINSIEIPDVSEFVTRYELNEAVEELATKDDLSQLNELVADVQSSLEEKANKEDIPDVSKFITEIPTEYVTDTELTAKGYLTEHQDISHLATKIELEEAINSVEHPTVDLTGYATEKFVTDAIAAIPEVDLSDYAEKTYVDEKVSSIVIPEIPTNVSEFNNDAGYLTQVPDSYATKEFVTQKIAEAELADKEVDLTAYYTKTETDSKIQEAINTIEIPDVSGKADKSELVGLATEQFVTDAIAKIPATDLSDYYTKAQTDSAINEAVSNIEIPEVDLTGYAKEQFVLDKIDAIEVPTKVSELENDTGYITAKDIPETDLSNYYTKTETETLVNDAVNGITIPEIPTNISAFTNDAKYTTLDEVAAQGYLKEHQSLEGYVKTAQLNDAIEAVEHKIVTKTSELENDAGFLTTSTLPDFVTPDEITEFVSLADVETAGFIKSIPAEYVTEAELEDKGYLTEHQSLEDYAKKSELPDVSNFATKDQIPSVEGLATETYVNQKVAEVVIPDVSNFVTENTVNTLLATKADNVPFTTNLIVKNPVGGFISDESVQNMTIAQILTKLLGLELYTEPEEPQSTAEKIIANEIPMYSIDSNGELVETSFNLIDGTAEPTESGFYTIRDGEGNIIEAGYQDLTIKNEEMYYIVALPNELDYKTNVKLQSWDPDESVWVDSELDLTSDPTVVDTMCSEAGVDITHIDKTNYTVWVVTGNSDPLCTGSILRYIIVEE